MLRRSSLGAEQMLLLGPVVLSLCLFFFSRHLYFVCAQHEHAATKHNHYKTDFHLLYKRRRLPSRTYRDVWSQKDTGCVPWGQAWYFW